MEPEESGIIRRRERRKVVLPEPEGPMTASLEPAGMVRVRFLRAGGPVVVVVLEELWGLGTFVSFVYLFRGNIDGKEGRQHTRNWHRYSRA